MVEEVAFVVFVDVGEDLFGDALFGVGKTYVEADGWLLECACEAYDVLDLDVGVGGVGGEGGEVDTLVVDSVDVEAGVVDVAGEVEGAAFFDGEVFVDELDEREGEVAVGEFVVAEDVGFVAAAHGDLDIAATDGGDLCGELVKVHWEVEGDIGGDGDVCLEVEAL